MEELNHCCKRPFFLLFVLVVIAAGWGDAAPLSVNFYSSSCPNVESIVRQAVTTKLQQTFTTVPATLRLFFHDCFVEGCDASVLIASPNNDAEKDAPDNISLAGDGFDTVNKAKAAVEAQCPGVVSCADVLAIAARDVVVLTGGPTWDVELGRRDGLISEASRVAGNLPAPTFTAQELTDLFQKNNISQVDMVALSGAHTVGFSHCSRFANRLYSFSPTELTDPLLNQTYAQELKASCPENVDPQIAVHMDPITPEKFDNRYFKNLLLGMGMFTSDDTLFRDSATNPAVVKFATHHRQFQWAFAKAMVNLGRTGVKTGDEGQIRRDCASFN